MKNEILILDDIFPDDLIDTLYKGMTNWDFLWQYHDNSTPPSIIDKNTVDTAQFTRVLLSHGEFLSPQFNHELMQILAYLQIKINKKLSVIGRIKSNLLLPFINFNSNSYHYPHIDQEKDWTTALLYLNDSDGDTFFFDNPSENHKEIDSLEIITRITPKKGRIVVFNSSILHAGSLPQNTNNRLVINFIIQFSEEPIVSG